MSYLNVGVTNRCLACRCLVRTWLFVRCVSPLRHLIDPAIVHRILVRNDSASCFRFCGWWSGCVPAFVLHHVRALHYQPNYR